MDITEQMCHAIEVEIDRTVEIGKQKIYVDYDKAKEVAKMVANLSMEKDNADVLTNQYIARIKNICNN